MNPVSSTLDGGQHVIGKIGCNRIKMSVTDKFRLSPVDKKGVPVVLLLSMSIEFGQFVELILNCVNWNGPIVVVKVGKTKGTNSWIGNVKFQIVFHVSFRVTFGCVA